MSTSVWRQHGEWFCKNCGHTVYQPHPDFLGHYFAPKICSGCGEQKMPSVNPWWTRTWTERRTFAGKWYLPWTWFRETVEVRDKYEGKAL